MEVTSVPALGSGPVAELGPQGPQLLQDKGSAGDSLGENDAGHALLAAARQEILRLQAVNEQLLLSHAEGEAWQHQAASQRQPRIHFITTFRFFVKLCLQDISSLDHKHVLMQHIV